MSRPGWIKVGAICEVWGEGRGTAHRIVEVDESHSRAAVERADDEDGDQWWKGFANLYQPSEEP